jgi:hypothetical protein
MIRTLAVTFGALITSACYAPSVESCRYVCNGASCPSGLACNAQGMCASSATDTCEPPNDAPMDGDSAQITVEVLARDGTHLKGATVVFGDRTGTQVDEQVTGAEGTVTSQVVPGGTATVIRTLSDPNGETLYATTYVDLWAGAHLMSQPDVDTRTRPVNIKWSPSATANQYEIRTSCVNPAVTVPGGVTSFDVPIPTRCTTFDVIVFAGPSTASPPPMSVVIGGQTGSSVMMPSTWRPYVQVQPTLTGAPTNNATVTSAISGWITPGVPSTTTFSSVTFDATGNTQPWRAPAGVNYTVQTSITSADPLLPGGTQTVIERLAAGATGYTRDLDGLVLPWVGNATFDRATSTFSWPMVSPAGVTAATPSVVFAELVYTRGSNRVVWRLVAPGSFITYSTLNGVRTGSLRMPDVPGPRVFEQLMPNDMITVDNVLTLHVGSAAVHPVIELVEPRRLELTSYVPTIDHLTFSQTPSNGTTR